MAGFDLWILTSGFLLCVTVVVCPLYISLLKRSRGYQAEVQDLRIRNVQLQAELTQQRQSLQDRLGAYEGAEQRMKESFKALSGDALRQSAESFLQLARGVMLQHEERAQGDLELRKQAVDRLIEPLARSLEKVENRIFDLEKQRVGAYQGLQEQIALLLNAQGNLQKEAANLAGALRSPTTRGRWGELQLRRIVELAGMLPHCDFHEQASSRDQEGRQLRPDMIVRLPGQRSIAIDSKVPLQAYLEAIDCNDEARRRELMKQHAHLLRKQVMALSQKSYWDQLEGSPDFVLLFLPGESFYSAALQADPSLIEIGADNRVLIATPTTLIALLRTTAYAWRQEDVTRYAQEISRLGRELYQRLADLSTHAVDMGKSLSGSVEAYNRMIGTLENRVLVTARRFQELKTDDPKKILKDLVPIDERARSMQAPDLLPS